MTCRVGPSQGEGPVFFTGPAWCTAETAPAEVEALRVEAKEEEPKAEEPSLSEEATVEFSSRPVTAEGTADAKSTVKR